MKFISVEPDESENKVEEIVAQPEETEREMKIKGLLARLGGVEEKVDEEGHQSNQKDLTETKKIYEEAENTLAKPEANKDEIRELLAEHETIENEQQMEDKVDKFSVESKETKHKTE